MMGVNNTMQLLIVGSNVYGDCILTLEYYKQASPYKLKMAPVHQQSLILCNPMESVGYVSLLLDLQEYLSRVLQQLNFCQK